jgi:ribosomal subunit interface protein
MKVPLELSVRNFELTGDLEDLIREKAAKLDNFYDGIISCRIVLEVPHRSQRKGVQYVVRIEVTVPGSEVVVKREPSDDLHVAVTKAFDTAERQLKHFAEKLRGDVKRHEEKPVARVSKIFPEDGYGFLITPEGREIYFHENALLGGKIEDLQPGTVVSFVERMGEEGAQASSVSVE